MKKPGRPKNSNHVFTQEVRAEILKALEAGLPLSYACDIAGIGRRTVYSYMANHPIFRTQVAISRAKAIQGLIALTMKQNGAWKLLKNLARDEFKENVEISSVDSYKIHPDLENKTIEELNKEYELLCSQEG